jgi:hypothetical protein
VAESGDRQGDQPWIELLEHVGRKAEAVEGSGPEVLDQHVRPPDQPAQRLAPVLALEVEDNRFLVPVRRHEVRRLRVVGGADERRSPGAGVVAGAGGFDLDHPGPEIAEHHGGDRAGECTGKVEHEDVVQWSDSHGIPFSPE